MPDKILILGILDVRGEEVIFLRKCLGQKGFKVVIMDIGFEGEPLIKADITRETVCLKAGSTYEVVKALKKDEAHRIVTKGAIAVVKELHSQEKLSGVIALGGATTSLIASSIMSALPFGLPKFIVSSAAAVPMGSRFFDSNDITIMHSLVNVAGLNSILKETLMLAAGAISGMAASTGGEEVASSTQISIATTVFGLTKRCAMYIRQQLEQQGYDVISFHAQGSGDRSMENLLSGGKFDAVIDIVPRRLSEQIFGGAMEAGENSFVAACRRGIPQVIAPGGLNLLAARRYQTQYNDRKTFAMDDLRVLVRLNKEEMVAIATTMAERLNQSRGPVKFLIPLRGWSIADPEGSPLYEPETDRIFVRELRNRVKSEIEIIEVDAWIEDPKFAREVVAAFKEVMTEISRIKS